MGQKPPRGRPPRDRSEQGTLIISAREDLPPPAAMTALASDPLPGAERLVLRKEAGPGNPVTATLASAPVIMGRAEGVAEVLLADPKVSRYHAGIAYRGGKYLLVDLGSANGTVLNGKLVGSAEVKDGDHITLGDTVLSFHLAQGSR